MFLVEEDNPSENIVIVEQDLDGIARDGIGNLRGFTKTSAHQ